MITHTHGEPHNQMLSPFQRPFFQVELGQPVPECLHSAFYWSDWGGGDNCSYMMCKAPVKSSSTTNQHQVYTHETALNRHYCTIEALCDYALYKSTFTLHYITELYWRLWTQATASMSTSLYFLHETGVEMLDNHWQTWRGYVDKQSSSQIIITNEPTPGVHTWDCSQ